MRISHHGQGGILFARSEPSKRLVASEAKKAQDAASWEAVPAGGPNANGHRASCKHRRATNWALWRRRCVNKCNVFGFTSLKTIILEPRRRPCFANDMEVASFQSFSAPNILVRNIAVRVALQRTEKIKCCGSQTKQLA